MRMVTERLVWRSRYLAAAALVALALSLVAMSVQINPAHAGGLDVSTAPIFDMSWWTSFHRTIASFLTFGFA